MPQLPPSSTRTPPFKGKPRLDNVSASIYRSLEAVLGLALSGHHHPLRQVGIGCELGRHQRVHSRVPAVFGRNVLRRRRRRQRLSAFSPFFSESFSASDEEVFPAASLAASSAAAFSSAFAGLDRDRRAGCVSPPFCRRCCRRVTPFGDRDPPEPPPPDDDVASAALDLGCALREDRGTLEADFALRDGMPCGKLAGWPVGWLVGRGGGVRLLRSLLCRRKQKDWRRSLNSFFFVRVDRVVSCDGWG